MALDFKSLIPDKERIDMCLEVGYFNLWNSQDLQGYIFKQKFKNGSVISPFLTGALLTLSYFHLLSAIQYFLSSWVLEKNSKYILQPAILRYYSIFFSIMGLVEAQFKGLITVARIQSGSSVKNIRIDNIRRRVYITNTKEHHYTIDEPRQTSLHKRMANWLFAFLPQWDSLQLHNVLELFTDEPTYFSELRNLENYSTDLLLEELHYGKPPGCPRLKYIEDFLDEPNDEFFQYFPEEGWALSFILALSGVHKEIIKRIKSEKKVALPTKITKKLCVFYQDSKYERILYKLV